MGELMKLSETKENLNTLYVTVSASFLPWATSLTVYLNTLYVTVSVNFGVHKNDSKVHLNTLYVTVSA